MLKFINKVGNFLVKSFGIIVTALIVSILFICLYRFGNALAIYFIFKMTASRIVNSTGMEEWVAYILSVPLLAFFLFVFGMTFSLNRKRRRTGRFLIMAFLLASVIFSSFVSRNYLMFPDGSARCYCEIPNGDYKIVPCSWTFDPSTGAEVRKITPEIATYIWSQRNGPQKVKRVSCNKDLRFFTPQGRPLIWYYQRQDGKIELFGHPGMHPQFGNVQLSPVTGDIVMKILEYCDSDQKDMVIANDDESGSNSDSGSPYSMNEIRKLRDVFSPEGGR